MKKLLLVAILLASALSGKLYAQAQWMNSLNDNIYISQMSLPGAHDAATGHGFSGLVSVIGGAAAGKCQDLELGGQWNAGVRVFDLRPTADDGCPINHGDLETKINLTQALDIINGKLTSNPSEFAIVLMRKEKGDASTWTTKVSAIFNNYSNVIPFRQNLRLGDVRGKILVLSRDYFADGYKIDSWSDNTTRDVKSANGVDFVVQDYYQVEDATAKSTAITNLLTEARSNNNTNCMFINHTSGYTGDTGTNSNINSNANTCNTLAYNTINENPGPTGIILMDYAGSSSYNGANLVSKIIAQNSNIAIASVSEPQTGQYYVYNVERDMYITRSNDYATRGGFDKAGMPIAVNNAGDGTLTLVTNVNGIGKGIFIADGNGETVYVDNTPTSWTFECVDATNQIYTLKNGDNYLQAKDGQTRLEADALPSNNSAKWQFVPRNVREDLSVASSTNPVDVTYLIENQGFDWYSNEQRSWKNADNSNWRPGDGWCHNADASNNCAEVWNATFDIHQSFAGIPNGVYELRVQGYYRISEGNNSDYLIAQMRAGENVQRTKYYINGTEAYLLPQLSATLPDECADNSVEINGTTYRYPNGKGKASIAFREGYYENEPIQAIVTDGNLTIGMKLDNKNGQDWNCFDNFRLYYLGLPDISQFTDALEAAIAAAQAFSGNTTTALQNALNTALAEAIAVRGSLDTDVLAAKTNALNAARANAEAADVTVLSATISIVDAEGIDVVSANDVLVNGTSAEQVSDALNSLRNLRNLRAMGFHEDVFTGAEVAEGDFYLYNVGARRFLCGYGNWGTHAGVGYTAHIATVAPSGEGWTIQTHLPNGTEGTNDFLGNNGYIDTDSRTAWLFEKVSDGIYRIINPDNNLYLGYNAATRQNFYQVDSDCSGADDVNNHWKLVTKAERDALLEHASESNPVDATYLMKRPGYDNRDTGWELWSENNYGDNGVYDRNGNHRSYVWQTWDAAQVDHYQVITGLRPGYYEVSVQGFYRWGDLGQTVAEYNENGNIVQGAYLYAYGEGGEENKETSFLMSILEEHGNMPGLGDKVTVGGVTAELPDKCYDDCMQYFEAGLYNNNKVRVLVGMDGTLRVGVYKTQNNKPHDWVVLDNWRLTYLGLAGVEIGAANYTTFVAPYDIDTMPDGVEAYACQVQTNSVHLEPVAAIPAGEAVVLKNKGTYKFSPATSAVELGTDNDLLPSDGTVQGGDNIYALANKTNGVGFYPVSSDIYVPAGKGYLVIGSGEGNVKSFYGFDDEDDPTGISTMDNGQWSMDNVIYNVAGQRMSKAQKGINIVNGKKIIK